MKRKLRIFSHLAIICLSVCMFAFGVYAASTVSVTTSGTVTFEATGVYAKVTRTVSGAKVNPSQIEQSITADATDNQEFKMETANEQLEFEYSHKPIVITFKIENLAPDRNLDIAISDLGESSANLYKRYFVKNVNEYGLEQTKYDGTHYNVNPAGLDGSVQVVIFELWVLDENNSFSVDYNYKIELSNQAEIASNVTVPSGTTKEKVGNTYLLSTTVPNGKVIDDTYTVTANKAKDYYPHIEGNNFVVPVHVYSTDVVTFNIQVKDSVEHMSFGSPTIETNGFSISSYSVSNEDLTSNEVTVPIVYTNAEGKTDLITELGYYSFYNYNVNLTKVNLPKTIKAIDGAFYNANKLETINLPHGLCYIGDSSFASCDNLVLTELPDTIRQMGDSAFDSDNIVLTKLPKNLEEVGYYPLMVSYGSSIIVYDSFTTPWQNNILDSTSSDIKIYFTGTEEQWNTMTAGNCYRTNITFCYKDLVIE